jgi:hypothetical protein
MVIGCLSGAGGCVFAASPLAAGAPAAGLAAALGLEPGVGDADDEGVAELLQPRTRHSANSATTFSMRTGFN